MFIGAVRHAGKADWRKKPRQKTKEKSQSGQRCKVFEPTSLFHSALVSCFFFLLCSEPFVSAHINALPGLIISHACHVCHLHSRTAKNERSRTILSRTKKRPLNFNNFIGWIPSGPPLGFTVLLLPRFFSIGANGFLFHADSDFRVTFMMKTRRECAYVFSPGELLL